MRDTIYRDDAIRVASGYCHPANVAKELEKLPSAEPEVIACGSGELIVDANGDLVSRQAVYEILARYDSGADPDAIRMDVEDLPSAQPERKTGRWIPVDDSGAVHFYKCSRCGYLVLGNGRKYCEDCGCKMEDENGKI